MLVEVAAMPPAPPPPARCCRRWIGSGRACLGVSSSSARASVDVGRPLNRDWASPCARTLDDRDPSVSLSHDLPGPLTAHLKEIIAVFARPGGLKFSLNSNAGLTAVPADRGSPVRKGVCCIFLIAVLVRCRVFLQEIRGRGPQQALKRQLA